VGQKARNTAGERLGLGLGQKGGDQQGHLSKLR
jgi:hypothetical protein